MHRGEFGSNRRARSGRGGTEGWSCLTFGNSSHRWWVGLPLCGLIFRPWRDDAAQVELWVQTLDRILGILVPHLIGGEATLEKLISVLIRAMKVLHRPAQRLLGLRLHLHYVGVGLGGGQVLLGLSQILQANVKLFALGLELPDAAIPLPS